MLHLTILQNDKWFPFSLPNKLEFYLNRKNKNKKNCQLLTLNTKAYALCTSDGLTVTLIAIFLTKELKQNVLALRTSDEVIKWEPRVCFWWRILKVPSIGRIDIFIHQKETSVQKMSFWHDGLSEVSTPKLSSL